MSASSVFMYANGKSMWAPEVLDAALEGVLEKQTKDAFESGTVWHGTLTLTLALNPNPKP